MNEISQTILNKYLYKKPRNKSCDLLIFIKNPIET